MTDNLDTADYLRVVAPADSGRSDSARRLAKLAKLIELLPVFDPSWPDEAFSAPGRNASKRTAQVPTEEPELSKMIEVDSLRIADARVKAVTEKKP
jgi:hypothetical protein